MSETLANVRKRVRFHLRDRNPNQQVFSSFELNSAIEVAMLDVAGEARLGQEWVTGLAISNSTDTYAAPGSLEYAQLLRVRLASTQLDLEPITREQFERLRNGDTSASTAGAGAPQMFVPYETPAQVLTLQLWPWPRAVDSLELLRSTLPTSLSSDAATLPFDKLAVEATAKRAAGQLIAGAADDVLAKLGLSRDAGSMLVQSALRGEKRSRIRRANTGQHAHTRRSRTY